VFLSDELSRSSETALPKRELVKLSWTLSQSRLSESLQLEREHSSRLSEGSQLERHLAWVLVVLRFMNVVGCLIG